MIAGLTLERFVAKAQLFHCAGAVVFQNDVGFFYKIFKNLFALWRLQIEGNSFLVAVEVHVIRAFAIEKRAHLALVGAFPRFLDFDDVGAHVRHHHASERPGQHPGKIENRDTFQSSYAIHSDSPF